jgi:hypothetical protein
MTSNPNNTDLRRYEFSFTQSYMRLFLLSVLAVRSLPRTQQLDLQLLNPLGESRLFIRKLSRVAVIITAAIVINIVTFLGF